MGSGEAGQVGGRPGDLVRPDASGLACPDGGFHVDPWRPVPLAVITHAHADHARPGSGRYIAVASSAPILRRRLGADIDLLALEYGEPIDLGRVRVSLHPAGHCLGSAQVRIEDGDRVAVVAGDYKRAPDPTCEPFEVMPCDLFVTEATFALPIYRWDPVPVVMADILGWWRENQVRGRVSVLLCYALGKAQRLLAELVRVMRDGERVFVHGALDALIEEYRRQGIEMAPTWRIAEGSRARGKANPFRGKLVLAPPSAAGSPWMRRFGPSRDVDTAFASGWMRVRGIRRRRGHDRGFAISDHADWPDLIRTVRETGASRVLCTHGYTTALARYLNESGIDAAAIETLYDPEEGE